MKYDKDVFTYVDSNTLINALRKSNILVNSVTYPTTKVKIMLPRRRGYRAGTKLAKLAGQLGKYTKAMINGNLLAKRQARSTIAAMIGV